MFLKYHDYVLVVLKEHKLFLKLTNLHYDDSASPWSCYDSLAIYLLHLYKSCWVFMIFALSFICYIFLNFILCSACLMFGNQCYKLSFTYSYHLEYCKSQICQTKSHWKIWKAEKILKLPFVPFVKKGIDAVNLDNIFH